MAIDLGMKILVVDDYATMLRIITNLLHQLNMDNVVQAKSGQEALQALKQDKFGLIISDWNMEPMTGLDLLKTVRSDGALKSTPFIMVTAESKTENVIVAKNAGVSNYIVKPFTAETLKKKIASIFGPF